MWQAQRLPALQTVLYGAEHCIAATMAAATVRPTTSARQP